MNAQQLVNYVSHNFGGTFKLDGSTLELFTSDTGYMVSRAGSETVIPLADFGHEAVTNYVKTLPDGAFFGVWVDSDKVYLDVSDHITTIEQAQGLLISERGVKSGFDTLAELALILGYSRNQKSIWNWTTKSVEFCPVADIPTR